MTANLPKGLVTNSDSITGDIASIDAIAIEDITKLWKAYTINKSILPNDIGLRLENLCWRIWSSETLAASIDGPRLAGLFVNITEKYTSIRTTPVPSPRLSAARASHHVSESSRRESQEETTPRQMQTSAEQPEASSNSPSPAVVQPSSAAASKSALLTTAPSSSPTPLPAPRRDSVQFDLPGVGAKALPPPSDRPKVVVPQSILKKPRSEPVFSPSSERSQPSFESALAREATRAATSSSGSNPSPTSPSGDEEHAKEEGNQGASLDKKNGSRRRKATFTRAGTKERRRPSFARRKSSQSSSSVTSLGKQAPKESVDDKDVKTPQTGKDMTSEETARGLTGSSRQKKSRVGFIVGGDGDGTGEAAESVHQGQSADREDGPDIQGTLSGTVDSKPRRTASDFLNRPLLVKTSSTVAASATAAAGQIDHGVLAEQSDKGKNRAEDAGEPSPTALVAPLENERDAEIPRTRSHLSLLFQRGFNWGRTSGPSSDPKSQRKPT